MKNYDNIMEEFDILMPQEEDCGWELNSSSTLMEDDKLKLLTNETRELIESKQFSKIFSSTFSSCREAVKKLLVTSFEQRSTIQVAKIVPILTKTSTSLLSNYSIITESFAKTSEISDYINKLFSEPLREEDLDVSTSSSLNFPDLLYSGYSFLQTFSQPAGYD